jgi:high affinity choline transporter 7
MRRFAFTTLIDPFEARYGKRWAAVLFLPAVAGEVFWAQSCSSRSDRPSA